MVFKKKAQRKARKIYVKAKSKRRSSNKSGLMLSLVGAGIYGAGREVLSSYMTPITSKIPAGGFADEIGLLVVNWALAKGKIPFINKMKITRSIGKAGMLIESARIGQIIGGGAFANMTNTGATTSTGGNSVR